MGTWSADTVGMYTTEVMLAGVPIDGSPFASKVFPSYADVQSVASGPGLTVVASGLASFQIRSVDRFSNSVQRNGDSENFNVRLDCVGGPCSDQNVAPIQGNTYQLEGGNYLTNYTTQVEGNYEVTIEVRRPATRADGVAEIDELLASPFAVQVEPANNDPRYCFAYGPGVLLEMSIDGCSADIQADLATVPRIAMPTIRRQAMGEQEAVTSEQCFTNCITFSNLEQQFTAGEWQSFTVQSVEAPDQGANTRVEGGDTFFMESDSDSPLDIRDPVDNEDGTYVLVSVFPL
eukprot:SAG31_NODE_3472_length_4234_cov_2.077872_1_plen_290_part_00